MAEISTGVWFDTKNSKVVDSPPEEGVQIVAPGAEMTPALEKDVQRYRDQETGDTAPVADAVTTDDVEKPAVDKPAKAGK